MVAHLIQPFMMTTSNAIMEQLGLGTAFDLENLDFAGLPAGLTVVAKGTPIFPRLDMEEESPISKPKWVVALLFPKRKKRMEPS